MLELKFTQIGVKHAKNEYERSNLIITNFAFGIGAVSSGLLVMYLFLIQNFASAAIILSGFILCILGFVLNHKGRFLWAIIAACGVTGFTIPIHVWFYPNNGVVAYLLTATVIVSFLSAQKPLLRNILVAYTFGSLIVSILIIALKHKGVHITPSNRIPFAFNLFFAMGSVALAITYFSNIINQQRQRLDKLNNIKNKLLAVLAHDLRGPLHNMLNLIEMLEEGDLDQKTSEKMMFTVAKEVKVTTNLLDDVLTWIRSQLDGIEINRSFFQLEKLAFKVVDEHKVKAELKGIIIDYEESQIRAFADKDMISLAIRNILSNAIKYCPKTNGKIKVRVFYSEGYSVVSIKDNGMGLKNDEIERINKKQSFTTQGTFNEKGFGLGLLLTQEFLLQNNSYLKVKNNSDTGAEFLIHIPIK